MSELEDKLNSLLSNQDAMAQVMQLAQSLSQSGAGAADSGSAARLPAAERSSGRKCHAECGRPECHAHSSPAGWTRAFIAAPAGAEPDESEREQRDLRAPLRAAALSARQAARQGRAGGAARQTHPSGQGISDDAGGVAVYNRYLRNDQGVYTCVPQEEPRRPPPPHREPPPKEPPRDTPPRRTAADRRPTAARSARAFNSLTSC